MNSIAVLITATGGARYTGFVAPLIASLKQFFPPNDVILFTDSTESFDAIKVDWPNLGWPDACLERYRAYLSQEVLLSKYSHIFSMDTDLRVVRRVEPSEICADGLTAVIHPGFPDGLYGCPNGYASDGRVTYFRYDSFERRPESAAYTKDYPTYYQCCFFGGSKNAFLSLSREIKQGIDVDRANNIVAFMYDESHLNRYLSIHTPAISLLPTWAWPGDLYKQWECRWPKDKPVDFTPRILHLSKPEPSWQKSEDVRQAELIARKTERA